MTYDGYLSRAGREIFNEERVRTYVQNVAPGIPLQDRDLSNYYAIHSAVGDAPYTTPLEDRAPWIDVADPDTHGFLGIKALSFDNMNSSTGTASTTESLDRGGVVGALREGTREMRFTGLLLGTSRRAVEAGFRWLKTVVNAPGIGVDTVLGEPGDSDLRFFLRNPDTSDIIVNYLSDPSAEGGAIPLIASGSAGASVSSVLDSSTGTGTHSYKVTTGSAAPVATEGVVTTTTTAVAGQRWWGRARARMATSVFGARNMVARITFFNGATILKRTRSNPVSFVPSGVFRWWTGTPNASTSEEYAGTVKRTNYMLNPGLEGGTTTGYVLNGYGATGTLSATQDVSHSGLWAGKYVAGSSNGAVEGIQWTIPAAPAGSVVSVWALIPPGSTGTDHLRFTVQGTDGAFLSSQYLSARGVWTKLSIPLTSTAAGATAFLYNDGPAGLPGPISAAGQVFYWDDVMVGDTGPYFDGTFPWFNDLNTGYYGWVGTPYASASTEVTPTSKRTNYAVNPTFANGSSVGAVQNIGGGNYTSSVVPEAAHTGGYGFRATATNPGAGKTPSVGVGMFTTSLPIGTYTCSLWLRHNDSAVVGVVGYAEGTAAQGAAVPSVLIPVQPNTWTRVSFTITTTSAGTLKPGVIANVSAAGVLMDYDDWLVESSVGPVAGTDFDGSTPTTAVPTTGNSQQVMELAWSGVAPAGTTSVQAEFMRTGGYNATVGDVFYLDEVMLTQSDSTDVPSYSELWPGQEMQHISRRFLNAYPTISPSEIQSYEFAGGCGAAMQVDFSITSEDPAMYTDPVPAGLVYPPPYSPFYFADNVVGDSVNLFPDPVGYNYPNASRWRTTAGSGTFTVSSPTGGDSLSLNPAPPDHSSNFNVYTVVTTSQCTNLKVTVTGSLGLPLFNSRAYYNYSICAASTTAGLSGTVAGLLIDSNSSTQVTPPVTASIAKTAATLYSQGRTSAVMPPAPYITLPATRTVTITFPNVPSGTKIWLSLAQCTMGQSLLPYFDGYSTDGNGYQYDWQSGAIYNAPSIRTRVPVLDSTASITNALNNYLTYSPPVTKLATAKVGPGYVDYGPDWNRYYFPLDGSMTPVGDVGLPSLLLNGTFPRSVRFRWYPNPYYYQNANQLDPESWVAEWYYITTPNDTFLMLDGVLQRIYAKVSQGTVVGAEGTFTTTNGAPLQWPELTGGVPYFMTMDVPVQQIQLPPDFYYQATITNRE